MQPIHVYDGCGTMDAEPYVDQPTPVDITPLKNSVVPPVLREMTKKIGMTDRCVFHAWAHKDSKYITQEDKERLVKDILENPGELFFVHLGTDRSVEIGLFLQEALAGSGKTIFLISAMKPLLHGLNNKDASQNTDGFAHLEYALQHIDETHEKNPGVYLVSRKEIVPGKFGVAIMDPRDVQKDPQKLAFVNRIRQAAEAERTFP